ncbi:type II/IV secretion system protein [Coprococcus sp. CAG:782]|jgi:type IV pilus assembly protein PilB|uniref:GspE/PulE family protein n=1 Tax=Coprococcus sp. OM04-5BH TaxID=2293093 RepID=UPI00033E5A0B|nr:ATPase, T2SS/T4P/T4SS family [Coprococcus sp. OM04-5BH]MEE0035333.1 ATPase, T2SS/T4P/T4SS family [Coprococcus sp.]RHV31924.1 type II secretion system protein GspE [Coprococcus sp. OM04-5BH]CCY53465.1 type II/IV secretion system protein [Coprococcus sp. CAG:782]
MRLGMGRKKIRIGDVLIAAGAITEEQLQEALDYQKENGGKLGNVLVELGFISDQILITLLTQQLGIDYISLKGAKIEDSVVHLVPEPMIAKYRVMPVEIDPDNPNILKVAMSDPQDLDAIDDISLVTNLQVEPMLANESDINDAIGKYYGSAQAMEAAEQYKKEQAVSLGPDENEEGNEDIDNSPIVLLVKQIIEGGVRQRASDIHIEALETGVRVRYRIDGALKQVMSYDLSILPGITARIKIIGGMDIAEKRKPQDGRITIMVDRKEFDVRVSILPTVFGEKTVMRLTSKDGLTKPKSGLGFDEEQLKVFDGILSNPHGIILVTGPTGSGKSTTLYTSLSELNKEDVNIITVEDPVEANINGINQVQVNVKAEMTFAAALRSILRQDPDIIMIGEIRDGETANIAVQAAITGHLVVSTLHTNSAASTITRLVDMGIEDYIVGDAVVGVIAQRLVRRLCTNCKQPRYVEDEERQLLGVPEDEEDVIVYEPVGCPLCNDTGYSGRIGVYEMMPVSRSLQAIIASGATADKIEKQALKEGMLTLRMGAAKHVLNGITSIAEMKKIVHTTQVDLDLETTDR